MSPFELIKIIIEEPKSYDNISSLEKKKNFFIINRRMAIKFPLQAHVLQHLKIDEVSVIDSWKIFLQKQYNKVPYWMYTKGIKKAQESKENKTNIKESIIKEFATKNNFDIQSVREALNLFPKEMTKELKQFEKIISS